MRTNILRTVWIMLLSCLYMGQSCGLAIWKSWRGTISRQWCNQELQRLSKRYLSLFKIKCTVHNPHHVTVQPDKATILMCNHSSLLDIPISLQAFPEASVRMLAKKELSQIPIMGKGMLKAEFPFIDRANRSKAIGELSNVKKRLESGIVMWIAPEGKRSPTGKLQAFKKGGFITAIQTGATIIPIGIRGATQILPANTFHFYLGKKADIHIGKPIDTADYNLTNKADLIDRVHKALSDLIQEPEEE